MGGEGVLGCGLCCSEFDCEMLYNIYIIFGLLLILIVNLGVVVINVVLNFDDSDYIFFVVDGMGGYVFVVMLVEYNENVVCWW